MFYRAMLKKENARKNGKKAFTLIELIIVIAIIGILIAILVPTMLGFLKEAKESTALANARTAYSSAAAAITFLKTNGNNTVVKKVDADKKAAQLLNGTNDLPAGVVVNWDNDENVTKVNSVTYTEGDITATYPVPPTTPNP